MSAFGGKAEIVMSFLTQLGHRTSIPCCSSEAAPNPYQSTRLSRYDTLSRAYGTDMRRREFLSVLGGAAVLAPFAARAQGTPVIGFLSSRSPGESASVVAAFRQGLRDTGFIEGQNVSIAFRWAEGRYDRLAALAAELVELRVTLLFSAGGPPAALAAKTATSTIPVVFSAASDPIGVGLVPSLNRPGGNVTGMGIFNETLGPKRLDLLKELVPSARVVGYLLNPSNPSALIETAGAFAVARALGIELHIVHASTEREIEAAYDEIRSCAATRL